MAFLFALPSLTQYSIPLSPYHTCFAASKNNPSVKTIVSIYIAVNKVSKLVLVYCIWPEKKWFLSGEFPKTSDIKSKHSYLLLCQIGLSKCVCVYVCVFVCV